VFSRIAQGVAWLVVGAAAATLGTVWHRAPVRWPLVGDFPLGLVIGLVLMLGIGVAARAVSGWAGLIGLAVGAFALTQTVALRGPGGDLMIQGDLTGMVWVLGAPVLAMLAALAPQSWFRRRDKS
jgi:hypothetical protein